MLPTPPEEGSVDLNHPWYRVRQARGEGTRRSAPLCSQRVTAGAFPPVGSRHGFRQQRPVRGSNSSHPLDRRTATPVASRGKTVVPLREGALGLPPPPGQSIGYAAQEDQTNQESTHCPSVRLASNAESSSVPPDLAGLHCRVTRGRFSVPEGAVDLRCKSCQTVNDRRVH